MTEFEKLDEASRLAMVKNALDSYLEDIGVASFSPKTLTEKLVGATADQLANMAELKLIGLDYKVEAGEPVKCVRTDCRISGKWAFLCATYVREDGTPAPSETKRLRAFRKYSQDRINNWLQFHSGREVTPMDIWIKPIQPVQMIQIKLVVPQGASS